MAELRLDPVMRRWVVTGKRPVMRDVEDSGAACPFCPGNERRTPKAIVELRDSAGAWSVRVFHDRAPVFRIEGTLDRRGEGIYDRMNTVGAHEVVVETRNHGLTLAQLPSDQIAQVIGTWCQRILDLKRDRRFRYVSLFKDQLPAAASFQGHSFSQIVATPVLPHHVEIEFRWSRFHFRRKDRCLYCDMLRQEIRQDKRMVDQDSAYAALCPFASRQPYELWILPLRHSSSFEKDLTEPGRIALLAPFFKSALQRVEKISDSLHIVVHTEPNLEARGRSQDWWDTIVEDFHWHIEIVPDIEGERRFLGNEGFYFNPVPAEEAALVLRALEPGGDRVPPQPNAAGSG